MKTDARIEKMYATPGFYWVGSGKRCFIVESDAGKVHQITRNYKRDGELSKEGWSGSGGEVNGPFATALDAEHAWELKMAWREICAS